MDFYFGLALVQFSGGFATVLEKRNFCQALIERMVLIVDVDLAALRNLAGNIQTFILCFLFVDVGTIFEDVYFILVELPAVRHLIYVCHCLCRCPACRNYKVLITFTPSIRHVGNFICSFV